MTREPDLFAPEELARLREYAAPAVELARRIGVMVIRSGEASEIHFEPTNLARLTITCGDGTRFVVDVSPA